MIWKEMIHLCVLVPLITYIGITILLRVYPKTIWFGLLVLFTFLLLIVMHLHDIMTMIRNIMQNRNVPRRIGVVAILLAFYLLGSHLYNILYHR